MNFERERAVGKYMSLQNELKRVAIEAGSHLHTLRDKTNTIIGADFLDLDLVSAKVLVDDLIQLQRRAKVIENKMNQIKETYGIVDGEL
jgi:hypothetical protein